MVMTDEMLNQGMSENGGWNLDQLFALGLGWRPQKGWRKRLIGTEIPEDKFALFLSLRSLKKQKEKVEVLRKTNTEVAAEIIAHRKNCRAERTARRKQRKEKLRQSKNHLKQYAQKKQKLPKVALDSFLSTYEWRRFRMVALKKYGSRCQCCGATPSDGAVMNVDHIKPRKTHPELALDVGNLQILCNQCNHGKGNWDATDWRPKLEAVK